MSHARREGAPFWRRIRNNNKKKRGGKGREFKAPTEGAGRKFREGEGKALRIRPSRGHCVGGRNDGYKTPQPSSSAKPPAVINSLKAMNIVNREEPVDR